MKYAGYMPNDFINGKGVCVSLWTQGCPHKCQGCHNPETWNENGGYEVPYDIIPILKQAIRANGIQRNFSVLGGEPLSPYNEQFTDMIVTAIRKEFPDIKIYLWTGYTLDELKSDGGHHIHSILNNIDVLIDGRYEEDKRDITLPLRGSSNQNIIEVSHEI